MHPRNPQRIFHLSPFSDSIPAMTRPYLTPFAVIAATIVLSSVTFSFQFSSFLHPKEIVLSLGLLALACLAQRPGPGQWTLLLPLWLLLGLGVPQVFLAQVPAYVVEEMARYATLLFLATLAIPWLTQPRPTVHLLHCILAASVVVALLGLVQFFKVLPGLFPVFPAYTQPAYSVFGNQDLFGCYCALGLILVWNVSVGEKWPGITHAVRLLLWLILLAALAVSGSRTAWLAACVGSLQLLFAQPRRVYRPLLFLYAFAAIALLLLMHPSLQTLRRITATFSTGDTGARIRFWIWDGALRMFLDFPLFGTGWGNFQYWSPLYLGHALNSSYGYRHLSNELLATHAHSEPLNILAEGGILGALLLGWLCARLLFPRRYLTFPHLRVVAAALMVLLVFSLFNDVWHSAPHAFAGLLLVGALLAPQYRPEPALKRSLWLPIAASLLLALNTWVTYLPSFLVAKAEAAHVNHENALPLYTRAVAYPWPQPRVHEQFALALLEKRRHREAALQVEQALKGHDSGQIYLYKGLAALAMKDEPTARQAFAACLYRFPRHTGVWRRLNTITAPEARAPLEAHRQRWLPEELPASAWPLP